jgi:hypothetical protein
VSLIFISRNDAEFSTGNLVRLEEEGKVQNVESVTQISQNVEPASIQRTTVRSLKRKRFSYNDISLAGKKEETCVFPDLEARDQIKLLTEKLQFIEAEKLNLLLKIESLGSEVNEVNILYFIINPILT